MVEFHWSATKVNTANYGTCRFYLRYVLGLKPLRLSSYVKGSFLHALKEHFYDRLGNSEEIRRNKKGIIISKKKYSNDLEFVDYARRKWNSILKADKSADDKIIWRFEGEGYVVRSQLKALGMPLFKYLVEINKPIFVELPFDFQIDGERFKGRIDEVRILPNGQIMIIDFKSGRPWIDEMKLEFDPQLTLYNVGLCSLLKFNRELRQKLGLEGRLEEFMAGNRFASPNIREGFFMAEALSIDPDKVKIMPQVIYETSRTDEHFLAFLKMIKSCKKRANEGDVYLESGRKCSECDQKVNCKMQMQCVNRGDFSDKKGNILFDFAAPSYAKKDDIGDVAFALTETPASPQLTKSQLNKISPQFRFRYPKSAP